jgi:S1-C subfamily serine protease
VFAASLVVTALVSAGAAVGITLAVTNNSTEPSSQSVTLPTAAPTGPSAAGNQSLNVAAIASRIEPATVDITSNGPNGQDEGTGMILTKSGLVLTNNHVVAGSNQFSAQVDGNGKSYPASVLGTDVTQDVALLQLQGTNSFKTVTLGNSSAIAVGDQVVAIGNALALPGPETVTNGIISATKRSITVSDPSTGTTEDLKGVFQTSAPINPGNSGGPLVDSAGQVIGMNTAAASGTGSGEAASNVGFAIPINVAMAIARQIEAGRGSATVQVGPPRAVMGVDIITVACAEGRDGCPGLSSSPFGALPVEGFGGYTAPVAKGAVVAQVDQGTPAQVAGLEVGDVIVSLDGKSVTTPKSLTLVMKGRKVGSKVTATWVDIYGHRQTATMSLVAEPAP